MSSKVYRVQRRHHRHHRHVRRVLHVAYRCHDCGCALTHGSRNLGLCRFCARAALLPLRFLYA
jgi:hypothetical protein